MSALAGLVVVFGVFFFLMGLMWCWNRLMKKDVERPSPTPHWAWYPVFGLLGALSYYIWQEKLVPDHDVATEMLGWVIGVSIFGILSKIILGKTGIAWPGVVAGMLYGAGSGAFLVQTMVDIFA